MSREAIARFLELAASDKSVEGEMNAAAERQDVPATAVRIGRHRGFEFTVDEFESVIAAFHREHTGEIDDAELAGVSGGLNPQPEPPSRMRISPGLPWITQNWAAKINPGF
jgi:predicted ribosomally synthesized peptide with nif11-like leader